MSGVLLGNIQLPVFEYRLPRVVAGTFTHPPSGPYPGPARLLVVSPVVTAPKSYSQQAGGDVLRVTEIFLEECKVDSAWKKPRGHILGIESLFSAIHSALGSSLLVEIEGECVSSY